VSNKINASKKQHVKLYIYTTVDEGSKGGGGVEKNTGTDGREQRASKRESSVRGG